MEEWSEKIVTGYELQAKRWRLEVTGSRLEAISINMFEVEGWRFKGKVEKNSCLKPQATCLHEAFRRRQERTSNLQQFFALLLARCDLRQK